MPASRQADRGLPRIRSWPKWRHPDVQWFAVPYRSARRLLRLVAPRRHRALCVGKPVIAAASTRPIDTRSLRQTSNAPCATRLFGRRPASRIAWISLTPQPERWAASRAVMYRFLGMIGSFPEATVASAQLPVRRSGNRALTPSAVRVRTRALRPSTVEPHGLGITARLFASVRGSNSLTVTGTAVFGARTDGCRK